ncbi:hypothetical protein CG405_00335, partial [Gardnerella vaginalis]
NTHEPGQGSFDPFESDNYDESKDYLDKEEDSSDFADDSDSKDANEEQDSCDSVPCNDDDLD